MTSTNLPNSIACDQTANAMPRGSWLLSDDSISCVSFMDDSSTGCSTSYGDDDTIFGKDVDAPSFIRRKHGLEESIPRGDAALPPLPRRRRSMDPMSSPSKGLEVNTNHTSTYPHQSEINSQATPIVSNKTMRSASTTLTQRPLSINTMPLPMPTLSCRQLSARNLPTMSFKGMVPPRFPRRQASLTDEESLGRTRSR